MYQKGLEAGAFLRLGAVERDEGRVEKAIEMLEQSLAITEAMSPASDEIIEFKCSAFMQLSEMYLGRSDLEQARRFAASARVAVDGALNRDSNALIWNRLDGACHRLSGRVNLALGKYRVAIEEFNASLSIREELLKAIPNDSSVEDDVAGVCRYLGQSYRLLGESDLAGTYYRRACEIRRRLYSADPDSVERNVNLCHAENSLAAWYMSLESADDDDLADALLQVVQVRISALERSDRSRTLSREADDLQDTVRRNLAVLARRRESGYGPN
jgi:tetratricopeptide (TPR) repeat protein